MSEVNVSVKQRLVGAVVLVSLGVIFLPMLLDGEGPFDVVKREKFIPEQPQVRQVFDVKKAELSRLASKPPAKSPVKPITKPVAKSSSTTSQAAAISEQNSEPFSVAIVDRISEEALKKSSLSNKQPGSKETKAADVDQDVAPAIKTGKQDQKDKKIAILSKPAKVIQTLKNNNEKTVKAWAVQLGSFKTKPNAFKLRDRLRGKGFPSYVESVKTKKGESYRVRVGPENLLTGAENLKLKLSKAENLKGIIVRH